MKPIIFAVLFFMLIVMVSSMSYQDEIEVERVYERTYALVLGPITET